MSPARPALREVADGVFLAVLPYRPLGGVNVYLLPADDGVTLVDTGPWPPEYFAMIDAAVRRVDARGAAAVHTILLTHAHTDHVGQAHRLHEASGATTHLDPRARDFFGRRYTPAFDGVLMDWLARHGLPADLHDDISGTLPPQLPLPDTADYPAALERGGRTWEVVRTGGHSPGHVALLDRAGGLLLAGDMILEQQVPLVDVQPFSGPGVVRDYLDGLEVLCAGGDAGATRFVLPAHGEPFTGLDARIDELRTHHLRRIEQVRAACDDGWRTAWEICAGIWAPRRRLKTRIALSQTIGYLGYLESDGAVRHEDDGGVVRWASASTGRDHIEPAPQTAGGSPP